MQKSQDPPFWFLAYYCFLSIALVDDFAESDVFQESLNLEVPFNTSKVNTKLSFTMPDHDDELSTNQTEGFKVGEKKTIEEYKNLGKDVDISSHF